MKKIIDNNKIKAFTLIELLVVIAIIGILATLAVVALSTARSSSRDAKRLADLKQLQTALEVYYNDYGSYPLVLSDLSSSTLPVKYLETIPTSPTPADGDCTATSNSYIYNTSYDKSSYSIHTCIGANTNSISKGLVVASPNGLVSWKCGENFLDERDNNSYKTIQFGNQCWFGENLAYLPEVQNNADFVTRGNNSQPAYGVHNYNGSDIATAKALPAYKLYGVYYNWFAAMDNSEIPSFQGACPVGWHVPSSTELSTLYSTINSETKHRCNGVSGYITKAMVSDSGWGTSSVVCSPGNGQELNNSSGFNAFSVRYRSYVDGVFAAFGSFGNFWTSSNASPNASYYYFGASTVHTGSGTVPKSYGFVVRCLKD